MFKLLVQHIDLVARFAKLPGIACDTHGCVADYNDDHACADTRDKPKPSGVGALFSDARREPFVRLYDDSLDKNIGLVTEGLAAVGSKDRKNILVALVSL